jgi:outer membrane receptor protein involved in Fe transport
MSSTRNLRKSVLCMAMGACLSSLVAGPVLAQAVTGAVAGRAQAGTPVTITNAATGQTRTTTVGADGAYRIAQLAPGDYTLTAGSGAPVSVVVSLGGTTTVNLASDGAVNLNAVQVVGSSVVNRVDVYSTESSTNLTREELARLPVDQTLGSVALLAPGVVSSGATFGGLTFGGSSVAENVTYINGLDVTDPFLRQGASTVPFAFYQEVQVKTGGYSAEFGRSTGGVINAVTRSGGNEFHGGVEFTAEPQAFQAAGKDRYFKDGSPNAYFSRDGSSWYKTNVWASGPLLKDRLFFFAMYENRDSDSKGFGSTSASKSSGNNGFWGGKLDWQIADGHHLEFLGFSDKAESTTNGYDYQWDTQSLTPNGETINGSGGKNWSLTYTGHFGENFVAKALYGENKRSATGHSPVDGDCSIVTVTDEYESAHGTFAAGCHPTNARMYDRNDDRKQSRLDFEWTLGSHLLRFGFDREVMNSDNFQANPGDGYAYTAVVLTPGADSGYGANVPAGVTQGIETRFYRTGSATQTVAEAAYIEDVWNVTDKLLLSLGARVDDFDNKVYGRSFIKVSNMFSPRLGFSYDMNGDGRTKLFGNLGRYYLPVTNKVTDYFGGGTTDQRALYVLTGWTQKQGPNGSYMAPVLGPQIGTDDTSYNVTPKEDFREAVAKDIKTPFQDEAIIGFQKAINQAWSWGVNATYRRMTRTLDDVNINSYGCISGDWPYINPGEKVTLWCEDTDSYITIDTSKDGYKKATTGEVVGYSKPRRTYKAVEFQLDRAWDDKWSFNASYIWSKSEGNFEGPVNSDTGYGDTGLTQNFDHPANNQDYGPLFNDHEHQVKLRGSFKASDMWMFGGTFAAVSGGPRTGFGTYWPGDTRSAGSPTNEYGGGGSFWHCVDNCSSSNPALWVMEYSPRGAYGRLPWVYDLSANVTWTLPVPGVDLKVRFSVYNLLNQQQVINVHSRYEGQRGHERPYFDEDKNWQSPRYAQLVVTYNF